MDKNKVLETGCTDLLFALAIALCQLGDNIVVDGIERKKTRNNAVMILSAICLASTADTSTIGIVS